jgi:hypothetical protein
MDPLSRKLFQDSSARARLAQMGGIVASYPELAKTVQRFNNGGSVTEPELEYVVIIPGLTDSRGMRVKASTLSELGQANPDLLQRSQVMDAPTAEQMGINVQQLRPGDVVLRSRMGVAMPTPPGQTFGTPLTEAVLPPAPGGGSPELDALGLPPGMAERLSQDELDFIRNYEDPTAATRAREAEVQEPYSVGQTGVGEFVGETFFPSRQEAFRKGQNAARTAAQAAATELPQDTGTPLTEAVLPPAREAAPEVDPLTAAANELMPGLRENYGVAPPKREPRDRRERVEQELEMIREIFGDKSKDEARERAMNLAMIGLAIASGQSPNMLTNIAQGALAGTQAMARAQEARRGREEEMKLLAYKNVLGQEEEERSFERQVQLAGLKGRGESRFGTVTHPLNQWFTTRNQLDQQARDPASDLWTELQKMPAGERDRYLDRLAFERVQSGFGADTPEIGQLRGSLESGELARARMGASGAGTTPEQEATLNAARQALARNPNNRQAIESRLRAVGIDPSLL